MQNTPNEAIEEPINWAGINAILFDQVDALMERRSASRMTPFDFDEMLYNDRMSAVAERISACNDGITGLAAATKMGVEPPPGCTTRVQMQPVAHNLRIPSYAEVQAKKKLKAQQEMEAQLAEKKSKDTVTLEPVPAPRKTVKPKTKVALTRRTAKRSIPVCSSSSELSSDVETTKKRPVRARKPSRIPVYQHPAQPSESESEDTYNRRLRDRLWPTKIPDPLANRRVSYPPRQWSNTFIFKKPDGKKREKLTLYTGVAEMKRAIAERRKTHPRTTSVIHVVGPRDNDYKTLPTASISSTNARFWQDKRRNERTADSRGPKGPQSTARAAGGDAKNAGQRRSNGVRNGEPRARRAQPNGSRSVAFVNFLCEFTHNNVELPRDIILPFAQGIWNKLPDQARAVFGHGVEGIEN